MDSLPPHATLNCFFFPLCNGEMGMFLKPCTLPGLFLIPDRMFPPEPSQAFHTPEHRVTPPATLSLPHLLLRQMLPALPSLLPPNFLPPPLLLPSSPARVLASASTCSAEACSQHTARGHGPAPLLCSGPVKKALSSERRR